MEEVGSIALGALTAAVVLRRRDDARVSEQLLHSGDVGPGVESDISSSSLPPATGQPHIRAAMFCASSPMALA